MSGSRSRARMPRPVGGHQRILDRAKTREPAGTTSPSPSVPQICSETLCLVSSSSQSQWAEGDPDQEHVAHAGQDQSAETPPGWITSRSLFSFTEIKTAALDINIFFPPSLPPSTPPTITRHERRESSHFHFLSRAMRCSDRCSVQTDVSSRPRCDCGPDISHGSTSDDQGPLDS
ncbi:unnamed protein product [Pleuronectes platessa]|uniref:Uncharacterized protein n=1 Tax=Pleuronectes platessa TaxID=8262 RepID=A0A9N7YY29_PLEPL|nr:unnamed protein product [Pleuronectes platessa]